MCRKKDGEIPMKQENIKSCNVCPRNCKADRTENVGFCGVGDKAVISRVGLHLWEEPCISYGKGSGTIFFAGCNLGCVFCQNHEISKTGKGVLVDTDTLCREMLALCDRGAVNINLVTPTHFTFQILRALEKVKHKLPVPVVYNCGGYESVETLKELEGYIDIYLPDIKYYSHDFSEKYSRCPDYFEKAIIALEEMHRQSGYALFDEHGHMKSGVMVRHLVLPSLYKDSCKILEELAKRFDVAKLPVSLMSQYFPTANCEKYPKINRRVTSLEYQKVVKYAKDIGFEKGFVQDKASAKEEYVPSFDYGKNMEERK